MSEKFRITRVLYAIFLLALVAACTASAYFAAGNYAGQLVRIRQFGATIHANEAFWKDVKIGEYPAWLFAKELGASHIFMCYSAMLSLVLLVILVIAIWVPFSRRGKDQT
jgi:hypothetical protein